MARTMFYVTYMDYVRSVGGEVQLWEDPYLYDYPVYKSNPSESVWIVPGACYADYDYYD